MAKSARVLDTVPVEQLARTRDDALSVLRVYEGIFVKPLVHRTSIAKNGPLNFHPPSFPISPSS